MNDVAIRVENLGKLYHIGRAQVSKTLKESLTDLIHLPVRKARSLLHRNETGNGGNGETIWALKDVSLDVKHQEILGIIGANGAGKSTLLKILSRITDPTEGSVEINGRVGSLLEVGVGFHPDLTGRENIYLSGAILGMKKVEIERKFDEIVSFAELQKFLDTPVKHYSSGMYVRLAFAVAAHLEPEILVVDEVLAVGDAAFQRKCLGKMGDVGKDGRTVLFVSHNMQAIRSLCHRCCLLQSGRLAYLGEVGECIDRYLLDASQELRDEADLTSVTRPRDLVDSSLRISRVKVNGKGGRAIFQTSQPIELEIQFSCTEPIPDVVFGFSIFSMDDIRLMECRSIEGLGPVELACAGEYRIRCAFDNILAPGVYHLGVGARCGRKGLEYVPRALLFEVHDAERYTSLWMESTSGFVRVKSRWDSPSSLLR